MDRYVCIHGHFYQPPRENAWLESIEPQVSAYPYDDWNQRISAECYAPNSAARILDSEGRIIRIVNNYANISFNFGPTLLLWMDDFQPEVYQTIIQADKDSCTRFNGHGSAIAQPYNHTILPLSTQRDKYTQILWGIRDFEHRFQRKPEGMWLPETAVDMESLTIMAELGIKFTILAPSQAKRVRRLAGRGASWKDISGGRIDPRRPYNVRLRGGKQIAVFFYDGPASAGVAFEGLLQRGEALAERLSKLFIDSNEPQLVHIATDGETYGHHHRHGEMALAYALHHIETQGLARLTNYSEHLEKFPPTHQVEIFENTSWSCAHGIERWRSHCGCNSGHSQWRQDWRAPLREALDWLRDTVAGPFEQRAQTLLHDAWAARDDYINVILSRDAEVLDQFLEAHGRRELSTQEEIEVLKLMELQRHAMLMYTSCGWFFDEISGIETVQVLQYAARVAQLAQELFGDSIEEQFLQRLEQAPSNLPEYGNGRFVYEKFVIPARLDLHKVGAHYGVSSVFEQYGEETGIHCYEVKRASYRRSEAGQLTLAIGKIHITSVITHESGDYSFAVLHLGDHNVSGGVRDFGGEEAYRQMESELQEAFSRADVPQTIRLIDRHFGASTYSLKSLFRGEQQKILNIILASTLAEADANYRQVYEHHGALMRFLRDLGAPIPKAFHTAAEFVLNAELRLAFQDESPDYSRLETIMDEVQAWSIDLDTPVLSFTYNNAIAALALRLREEPTDVVFLRKLETLTSFIELLPFEVELWTPQNTCYELLLSLYPTLAQEAMAGDEVAEIWVQHFRSLADRLSIKIA